MLCRSLTETENLAKRFITRLRPKKNQATVAGLFGELGSGKTTFVQAAARALGIKEPVTSPTFVIEKIFRLPRAKSRGFSHLVHLDCYRIEKPEEIIKLGWPELLSDPTNLIFIEWAERVASLLPPKHHRIRFKFLNAKQREIDFV